MARPDVLVLVLAGGAGGRLELLTEQRAKPAVPFAGMYRLIDFPLSNCLHSAISDVWVLQQYQPASLNDHLANGRPWDLDRTAGGLRVLPPHEGTRREGFTQGTADGLWRNASLIRELGPRQLVVVSADAVYRLNYRDVLDAHRATGAALTMVTTSVDHRDAGRYGVVQIDGDRVVDYAYKPDEPAGDTITTEVFVMEPDAVLDTLEQLKLCGTSRIRATGATWARWTRTGRRTWTSFPTSRRWTWTTPPGRSAPRADSARRRGWPRPLLCAAACSRQRPRWPGT
jgi:glucose-1-phosphate adenylyltransferase